MANICDNTININFKDDEVSEQHFNKVLKEFEEEFSYEYFDSVNCSQDFTGVEIYMGTRWSCPEENQLQKFAEKYNLRIMGVSYEFSNDYVHSFIIE